MSNHSAKFVSAIFASILAGTSFAAGSGDWRQRPADNCLSGPKGTVPAGHHWYYRIDHATKRHCWYSRAERQDRDRARRADRTSSSPPLAGRSRLRPPANPAPPPQTSLVRKSIADARAELTAPQMRVEDHVTPNRRPAAAAPAASLANSPRAVAPDAPASSVARRFALAGIIRRHQRCEQSAPAAAEPKPAASPQTDASAGAAARSTPVALAAADSSQEKQSASMQMLLLTLAGALALAGITASLIFRFGRARAAQPEIRNDRRAIWDQVHAERSSPSIFPDEDMPVWHANDPPRDLPRDPRAPDDPERRVTEMLARLARSAQT